MARMVVQQNRSPLCMQGSKTTLQLFGELFFQPLRAAENFSRFHLFYQERNRAQTFGKYPITARSGCARPDRPVALKAERRVLSFVSHSKGAPPALSPCKSL
jgi:hypothetical protein